MANYTRHGKIQITIEDDEFFQNLKTKEKILGKERAAFVSTLYYFGIRVSEALKLHRESFKIAKGRLFVDVGERLKNSKQTPPLSVKLDRPYVGFIVETAKNTKANCRVWKFSRVTAWRIVSHHFDKYPHYYRLNRITRFFEQGYPISKVKSWTGLTLRALDFYVGVAGLSEMGDSI